MFDVANPVNPIEVGKYETWRDPDGNGTFTKSITQNYNGAWNIYSGLPSGNVLLSDTDSGLFVLKVDQVEIPVFADNSLTAEGKSNGIALDWKDADSASGYDVFRSTTSGSGYQLLKENLIRTSYTDASANPDGTSYYYIVQAKNAGGQASTVEAQMTRS